MWLECGKGGVHQKEGDLRSFQIAYIHGSPVGLEFAVKHPRTLPPGLVIQLNNLRTAPLPRALPRALPRIQAVQVHCESGPFDVDDATKPSVIEQVTKHNATTHRRIPEDDDDGDGGGEPQAIEEQVTKPSVMLATKPRFHIPEDDDDDDDDAIKPSAMLDTKPPAQHRPMSNRTNHDGTEPQAKRQQTLAGEWAPEPTTTKKPKTSKKSKTSGTQLTLRFGQTTNPKKAASTKKTA